jgi:hypothetical protein
MGEGIVELGRFDWSGNIRERVLLVAAWTPQSVGAVGGGCVG